MVADVRSDSDRKLSGQVTRCLADRHMPSLRRLVVEAQAGTVTLRGHVRSFFEKQICLETLRHMTGVELYVDAIEVDTPLPGEAV